MERKVVAAARAGEWSGFPDEPPATADQMKAWGASRTVRASVLRDLLLDTSADPRGVGIVGVRITGALDLDYATVAVPLTLENCFLDGDLVSLLATTIPRLVLSRCRIAGLVADGLVAANGIVLSGTTSAGPVTLASADLGASLAADGLDVEAPDADGDALFAQGVRVRGSINLRGASFAGRVVLDAADVTGQANLSDVHITGHDLSDYSLSIDNAVVGFGVFLTGNFVAAGAVRAVEAIVGGLDCTNATIRGRDSAGASLAADRIQVSGAVYLGRGFECTGAVRFSGARVGGGLEGIGALSIGTDDDGDSLMAEGATFGVQLRLDGATVAGAIRLTATTVEGPFSCRDARITGANHDGNAVYVAGMTVHGDVFFDGTFSSPGTLHLRGAHIDGVLTFDGATLAGDVALLADGAVLGDLDWRPCERVQGYVSLDHATTRQMIDDWTLDHAHWPPQGRLSLTGFTYRGFGTDAPCARRLDWLRLQHGRPGRGFAAQPYRQLEKTYRDAGQDTDAREVAIARHNDLRTYGDLTWLRRRGSRFLDVTIRHGYKPGRAVVFLLAVYVAITTAFAFAQHEPGALVPTDTKTTLPRDAARHCRPGYECFYPALYALDVMVPILDVKDADGWRPDATRDWGWAYVWLTVVGTTVGWGATTLAVVGFTNVVRKE